MKCGGARIVDADPSCWQLNEWAQLASLPKQMKPSSVLCRAVVECDRDGRVVSTKGEKIIVEKVGEDWDGGSR